MDDLHKISDNFEDILKKAEESFHASIQEDKGGEEGEDPKAGEEGEEEDSEAGEEGAEVREEGEEEDSEAGEEGEDFDSKPVSFSISFPLF